MAVTLGTPLPALPLGPVSVGLITQVPQVSRLLVMAVQVGCGGGGAGPPTPQSPLVRDRREEAYGCHGSAGCAVVVVREC